MEENTIAPRRTGPAHQAQHLRQKKALPHRRGSGDGGTNGGPGAVSLSLWPMRAVSF